MGGTDCGFAQGAFMHRVHEEIQWAKLAALVEGARIASRELWGATADLSSRRRPIARQCYRNAVSKREEMKLRTYRRAGYAGPAVAVAAAVR